WQPKRTTLFDRNFLSPPLRIDAQILRETWLRPGRRLERLLCRRRRHGGFPQALGELKIPRTAVRGLGTVSESVRKGPAANYSRCRPPPRIAERRHTQL